MYPDLLSMVFLCLVSLADIKSQYECDKEQWTCTQDDCLNRNCTCSNNGVCKQMCPDTRKWTPFNVCPKMACTAEEQCAQLADRKTNIMDGKSKVVTQHCRGFGSQCGYMRCAGANCTMKCDGRCDLMRCNSKYCKIECGEGSQCKSIVCKSDRCDIICQQYSICSSVTCIGSASRCNFTCDTTANGCHNKQCNETMCTSKSCQYGCLCSQTNCFQSCQPNDPRCALLECNAGNRCIQSSRNISKQPLPKIGSESFREEVVRNMTAKAGVAIQYCQDYDQCGYMGCAGGNCTMRCGKESNCRNVTCTSKHCKIECGVGSSCGSIICKSETCHVICKPFSKCSSVICTGTPESCNFTCEKGAVGCHYKHCDGKLCTTRSGMHRLKCSDVNCTQSCGPSSRQCTSLECKADKWCIQNSRNPLIGTKPNFSRYLAVDVGTMTAEADTVAQNCQPSDTCKFMNCHGNICQMTCHSRCFYMSCNASEKCIQTNTNDNPLDPPMRTMLAVARTVRQTCSYCNGMKCSGTECNVVCNKKNWNSKCKSIICSSRNCDIVCKDGCECPSITCNSSAGQCSIHCGGYCKDITCHSTSCDISVPDSSSQFIFCSKSVHRCTIESKGSNLYNVECNARNCRVIGNSNATGFNSISQTCGMSEFSRLECTGFANCVQDQELSSSLPSFPVTKMVASGIEVHQKCRYCDYMRCSGTTCRVVCEERSEERSGKCQVITCKAKKCYVLCGRGSKCPSITCNDTVDQCNVKCNDASSCNLRCDARNCTTVGDAIAAGSHYIFQTCGLVEGCSKMECRAFNMCVQDSGTRLSSDPIRNMVASGREVHQKCKNCKDMKCSGVKCIMVCKDGKGKCQKMTCNSKKCDILCGHDSECSSIHCSNSSDHCNINCNRAALCKVKCNARNCTTTGNSIVTGLTYIQQRCTREYGARCSYMECSGFRKCVQDPGIRCHLPIKKMIANGTEVIQSCSKGNKCENMTCNADGFCKMSCNSDNCDSMICNSRECKMNCARRSGQCKHMTCNSSSSCEMRCDGRCKKMECNSKKCIIDCREGTCESVECGSYTEKCDLYCNKMSTVPQDCKRKKCQCTCPIRAVYNINSLADQLLSDGNRNQCKVWILICLVLVLLISS